MLPSPPVEHMQGLIAYPEKTRKLFMAPEAIDDPYPGRHQAAITITVFMNYLRRERLHAEIINE